MANYCSYCGAAVSSGDTYCPNCGAVLSDSANTSAGSNTTAGANTAAGTTANTTYNNTTNYNTGTNATSDILGTLVAVTLVSGMTRNLYYYGGRYFLDPYCRQPFYGGIRGPHRIIGPRPMMGPRMGGPRGPMGGPRGGMGGPRGGGPGGGPRGGGRR